MSKFDYSATVVATLAHLLMQQKDTFGLALFSRKVTSVMPAKGSRSPFRTIIAVLYVAKPQGET